MKLFSFISNELFRGLHLFVFKLKWKKNNKHNHTLPGRIFDEKKVEVGKGTYGELNVYTFNNPKERLKIGHFCSIAPNVQFILGGEHEYNTITTYPCEKYMFHSNTVAGTKGLINVDDDVWIGQNSTVLSGVKIGQGAIIGAGSVVYKDIPPYSIYAGYAIVRNRFSEDIISKLLTINYNELNYNKKNVREALKRVVNENSVDSIIKDIFG